MAKKKAFGGYAINFKGQKETLEKVFGTKPLAPSQMTKKIWTFIKKKRKGLAKNNFLDFFLFFNQIFDAWSPLSPQSSLETFVIIT